MGLRDIEITVKPHFNWENEKRIAIYAYLFTLFSLFLNVALFHIYYYNDAHKDQLFVYDSTNKYKLDDVKGIKRIVDANNYKVKVHTPSFNNKYDGTMYLMSKDNYKINNGRDIINKDEIVCPDIFAPDQNVTIFNIVLSKHILFLDFYHRNINIDKNSILYVVGTYDSSDRLNDSNVCYASDELLKEITYSDYNYNKGYNIILNSKKDRKSVIKQIKKKGYRVKKYTDDNFKYEKIGTLLIFDIWFSSMILLLIEINKSLKRYKEYVKNDSFIDENYIGIELFNLQLSKMVLFVAMMILGWFCYYYVEYIFINWVFLDLEYLNIKVPFNWLGYISLFLIVTIYPMMSMNWFNFKYSLTCRKKKKNQ